MPILSVREHDGYAGCSARFGPEAGKVDPTLHEVRLGDLSKGVVPNFANETYAGSE